MAFNLLTAPFFPVVTASGDKSWVSFADLAREDTGAAIDFAWPRADFNMAAYEMAIGLATLAFQPVKNSDWTALWSESPGSDRVQKAIEPFVQAFDLNGDGPRFMQDFEPLAGDETPVEALLIDTPGANGQRKNADLLTHRARYGQFGLPAAAMALYTLQQFAPSGGAGNRTSMRGGGPLSTIVIPSELDDRPVSLWKTILANIVVRKENAVELDRSFLPRILPWLAPTLLSDKANGGYEIHEADKNVHCLQAFFGMPRRVRLVFHEEDGVCAMTGQRGPVVTGFIQKPWGMNYGLWSHPLTPYRRQKEGEAPYSVKPKSGRFGYRDWVAATVGDGKGTLSQPAANVEAARNNRAHSLRGDRDARLRAGGWAMNNMEATTYLFAEQPFHLAQQPEHQQDLDETARRFADAGDRANSILRMAIRNALFAPGASVATDNGVFPDARHSFFETTEDPFHQLLDEFTKSEVGEGDGMKELQSRWLGTLRSAANKVFETFAPLPLDRAEEAERIAKAGRMMSSAFWGHGPSGRALFDILQIVPSEKTTKKPK